MGIMGTATERARPSGKPTLDQRIASFPMEPGDENAAVLERATRLPLLEAQLEDERGKLIQASSVVEAAETAMATALAEGRTPDRTDIDRRRAERDQLAGNIAALERAIEIVRAELKADRERHREVYLAAFDQLVAEAGRELIAGMERLQAPVRQIEALIQLATQRKVIRDTCRHQDLMSVVGHINRARVDALKHFFARNYASVQ
jgi:hypothetical protein